MLDLLTALLLLLAAATAALYVRQVVLGRPETGPFTPATPMQSSNSSPG